MAGETGSPAQLDDGFWTVKQFLHLAGVMGCGLVFCTLFTLFVLWAEKKPPTLLGASPIFLPGLSIFGAMGIGSLVLSRRVARGERLRRGSAVDPTEADVFLRGCTTAGFVFFLTIASGNILGSATPASHTTISLALSAVALIVSAFAIRGQWRRAKAASAQARTRMTVAMTDTVTVAPALTTMTPDDSVVSVTVGRR